MTQNIPIHVTENNDNNKYRSEECQIRLITDPPSVSLERVTTNNNDCPNLFIIEFLVTGKIVMSEQICVKELVDFSEYISSYEDVRNGELVLKNTRIPIKKIAGIIKKSEIFQELKEDYKDSDEALIAALFYETFYSTKKESNGQL